MYNTRASKMKEEIQTDQANTVAIAATVQEAANVWITLRSLHVRIGAIIIQVVSYCVKTAFRFPSRFKGDGSLNENASGSDSDPDGMDGRESSLPDSEHLTDGSDLSSIVVRSSEEVYGGESSLPDSEYLTERSDSSIVVISSEEEDDDHMMQPPPIMSELLPFHNKMLPPLRVIGVDCLPMDDRYYASTQQSAAMPACLQFHDERLYSGPATRLRLSSIPTMDPFHSLDEDIMVQPAAMSGWGTFQDEELSSSDISKADHNHLGENGGIMIPRSRTRRGWVTFDDESLPPITISKHGRFKEADQEVPQQVSPPPFATSSYERDKDDDQQVPQHAVAEWQSTDSEELPPLNDLGSHNVQEKKQNVVTRQPTKTLNWRPVQAERLRSIDIVRYLNEIMAEEDVIPGLNGMFVTDFDIEPEDTENEESQDSNDSSESSDSTTPTSDECPPSTIQVSAEPPVPPQEESSCCVGCCGFCLECVDGLFP